MDAPCLTLDYFRAHESEQYAFFRIPKLLISDARYKTLSSDAKILYGLMLDRMCLSVKKGWLDGQGRVFIIYPQDKAAGDLNRSVNTLTTLFKELAAIGLIVRKRQGQGKPDIVYVMNFASGADNDPSLPKAVNPESQGLGFQNPKTCDSRTAKNGIPEMQDLGFKNPKNCDSYIRGNKTENYKTDTDKTETVKTTPTEAPEHPRKDGDGESIARIDREELIRLSQNTVRPPAAGILADAVLEAFELLCRERDGKIIRLTETADAAVLADFIAELAKMDLSHVGNLTAYLKRVLADFLRKHSLRGAAPAKRETSYGIDEIEAWLIRGGDLYNWRDESENPETENPETGCG